MSHRTAARKGKKDTKRERSQRSRGPRRMRGDWERMEIGPNVESATPEAVLRALTGLPDDLEFDELADDLVPIFPRLRPWPDTGSEPVRVVLPPGLSVGFGVDIGPAFISVDEGLARRWGHSPLDLTTRALTNLRSRAALVRPRDVVREHIDGVPVRALQTGLGCASTLVLIPDELRRILGAEPSCVIAPMRDLLMAFPADADRDLVAYVRDEIAAQDPNALALEAFVVDADSIRCEALGTRRFDA